MPGGGRGGSGVESQFGQPRGDQFGDQRWWQRLVDGEVQRAFGVLVACEVGVQSGKYRAAVGQVAQVVLERREAGDWSCRWTLKAGIA